jgi:phospholipid/cholesterol/gamma-HCH transport system substrate-binding protein
MQYSNELKVGAAIVLAAVAAFIGIRFFQNVPLVGSSYTLYAEFDNANGLVAGKPVRMKGVKVGSVERVRLDPQSQLVRVEMKMERGPRIPEGSEASVAGISALGGVHVSIAPGPRDNPQLPPEATLGSPDAPSSLSRLTEQAPALASKADSVLRNTNATMTSLNRLLRRPDSDLRQTLGALRGMATDLEQVTDAEKATLQRLFQNLEAVSGDLEAFTDTNTDSLSMAVRRLNRSLDRLNRGLASFERTSATLDTVATKLNNGRGTAGRLLNDPSLYLTLDSAAVRANRVLEDFQRDPGRYLEDLTLVKVF